MLEAQTVDESGIANLRHLEKISAAMPDAQNFEFTGIVNDLGAMAGHCACGHPIRYEFIVAHKTSGKQDVLGSVCIESSVPYIIASGNEVLAAALMRALEELEERKREAMKQLRDAKNSEDVQTLEAYWENTIKPWHKEAREEWKSRPQKGSYTGYPDFLYKPLPALKAMSTPGRTASSIRRKIVTLARNAFERDLRFPPLPYDEKLRQSVEKELNSVLQTAYRRAERGVNALARWRDMEKLAELPNWMDAAYLDRRQEEVIRDVQAYWSLFDKAALFRARVML